MLCQIISFKFEICTAIHELEGCDLHYFTFTLIILMTLQYHMTSVQGKRLLILGKRLS